MRFSMFVILFVPLLLALLLPFPLLALRAAPGTSPAFDRLDRNRDGFVDWREAGRVPGLVASFEKIDRNADGRLDRVEFARW